MKAPPDLPEALPASAYEENGSHSLTLIRGEDYAHYSLEEVMGRRLNGWKGWLCAAGVDGLFINADGNVYVATCKVGGILANVFDGALNLSKAPIECTKEWCMCGADMQLPKARTQKDMARFRTPPSGVKMEHLTKPDRVMPFPFKAHWQYPISITWDLGRRCNFSCSYCHPDIANNYESHKSFGSLKYAVDNIVENFSRERLVKWVLTGGEPTVNPAYLDLVKYLTSKGHLVHTQTNFSRSPEYFAELIRYSLLGVSLHLENFNEERFIRSVQAVLQAQQENAQAKNHWFGIRIMVPPGYFPLAKKIWNKVTELPGFNEQGQIFMSTVHEQRKISQLMAYQADELNEILTHS